MTGDSTPEWMCAVCLYVQPRPGLDEDERAELEVLTIIDGQLVCVRHAGAASSSGHHDTIRAAVHLESQGTMTSLDEYQRWRGEQDGEDRNGS
jgi:hypothetical protein